MDVPSEEKIRIALVETPAYEATRIGELVSAGSLSTVVSELADAAIILLGLGRLDAPEKEALARVRAGFPHTPVIVLAGTEDTSWTGEALSLGVQHVLDKGRQTPEKLASTIRYYVRYGRRLGP